jgi:hypothetical protein
MAENTGHRASQIKSADRKGNGTQVQMFGGGSTSAGAPAVFDTNGNVVAGTSSGGTATGEVPSGTQNGVNPSFSVAHTPIAGTLKVYRNGDLQDPNWVTISGSSITFVAPPRAVDQIYATYTY